MMVVGIGGELIDSVDDDDDDDEFTLDEWAKQSKEGEVCGMFGCTSEPSSQCPICGNHYCYDHIKAHFHAREDAPAT